MQQSSDVATFSRLLDEILNSANEQNKTYLMNEQFVDASEISRLVSDAYNQAEQTIQKQNFSSLKDLSDSFSTVAKHWSKEADHYLELNSTRFLQCFNDAKELQLQNKHRQAINLLKKALSMQLSFKERYQTLLRLGNSYFYLNELVDAKNCYEEAVTLEPDNSLALGNLGIVLTNLGFSNKACLNEAMVLLNKAIEANPDDPVLHYALGGTYYFMGKFKESIQCFNASVSKDEECADAWTALAVSYNDGFRNYVKAIECLSTALKIDPGSLYTKINLAEVLLLSKQYNESQKIAKEVYTKTNSLRFGLVARIIVTLSCYLQDRIRELTYDILDLSSYHESLGLGFNSAWNTQNILKEFGQNRHLPDSEGFIDQILSLSHSIGDSKKKRERMIEYLKNKLRKTRMNPELEDYMIQSLTRTAKNQVSSVTVDYDNIEGKYRWRVILKTPNDIASGINEAKCQLPSTFPKSENLMTRIADGFVLEGFAWKNFQAKIIIRYNDGLVTAKYHWVRLQWDHKESEKGRDGVIINIFPDKQGNY